jgi:hypothetical protein
LNYNICGIPITKEHALRIAQTNYDIHKNFPTGNMAQDTIDIKNSLDSLDSVKQDILKGSI